MRELSGIGKWQLKTLELSECDTGFYLQTTLHFFQFSVTWDFYYNLHSDPFYYCSLQTPLFLSHHKTCQECAIAGISDSLGIHTSSFGIFSLLFSPIVPTTSALTPCKTLDKALNSYQSVPYHLSRKSI